MKLNKAIFNIEKMTDFIKSTDALEERIDRK